jgi:hypothetical protein
MSSPPSTATNMVYSTPDVCVCGRTVGGKSQAVLTCLCLVWLIPFPVLTHSSRPPLTPLPHRFSEGASATLYQRSIVRKETDQHCHYNRNSCSSSSASSCSTQELHRPHTTTWEPADGDKLHPRTRSNVACKHGDQWSRGSCSISRVSVSEWSLSRKEGEKEGRSNCRCLPLLSLQRISNIRINGLCFFLYCRAPRSLAALLHPR